MRESAKLFAILFLFWMVLAFQWNLQSIGLGVFFAVIAVLYSKKLFLEVDIVLPNITVISRYLVLLLKEIMISSVIHLRRIVSKDEESIVVIDLVFEEGNLTDWVMMANFITLTPGTLSIEVDNRRVKVLAIESAMRKKDQIEQGIYETYRKIFRQGIKA